MTASGAGSEDVSSGDGRAGVLYLLGLAAGFVVFGYRLLAPDGPASILSLVAVLCVIVLEAVTRQGWGAAQRPVIRLCQTSLAGLLVAALALTYWFGTAVPPVYAGLVGGVIPLVGAIASWQLRPARVVMAES